MKNEAILIILFSASCSLSYGKTCYGTNDGLSTSGNLNIHLKRLSHRYKNCTQIEGNLEIVSMPPDTDLDLSFLKDIEEVTGYVLVYDIKVKSIPLPKLRLIRGRSLFPTDATNPATNEKMKSNVGLLIAHNKGLLELGLDSLIEISTGDVLLQTNDGLCNQALWNDTLADKMSKVHIYPKPASSSSCTCHKACPAFEGNKYCWGPEPHQCQRTTKSSCHESCAGGCTGLGNEQCFRCKTLKDDGACIASCPPEKYSYDYSCVSKCPGHVYTDGSECVNYCKEGQTGVNGVCKPCDGPCPKSCRGTGSTFLSNLNIEDFKDCVVINGNLVISDTTFEREYNYTPLTYTDLSVLESVTLIEGTLLVDASSSSFTNMSFLRNLEIIRGNQPVNNKFGLYIFRTSLQFLGLDSLKEVANGMIVISSNSFLCDEDMINWTNIIKSPTSIKYTDCVFQISPSKNDTCHRECDESGCFGPLESQCLKCKSYVQDDRCVPSCELGWFGHQSKDGSKRCSTCHRRCKESCTGPRIDQCVKCLDCKIKCPEGKYADENGTCKNCSSKCIRGCLGPEDNKGPRGCIDCNVEVKKSSAVRKVRCLPFNSSCDHGYYRDQTKGCQRCHSECLVCSGASLSDCFLRTCRNVIHTNSCVTKCPETHYIDINFQPPHCQPCHEFCLGCRGKNLIDCKDCRFLTYFLSDEDVPNFTCTKMCPSWLPYEAIDNITLKRICVADQSRREITTKGDVIVIEDKSNNILLAGIAAGVGSAVIIVIIVIIACLLRKATSDE